MTSQPSRMRSISHPLSASMPHVGEHPPRTQVPPVPRLVAPPRPLREVRSAASTRRPEIRGKFIYVGEEKFWVRGVTYGAFRPDGQGNEYHRRDVLNRDFAQMARHGINTVRIPHTTPPRAVLDVAYRHGLRVMVGLSAEQYIGFLIDEKDAPDIEALVRARARSCAGHPALLGYALGNEVPAPVARWLGRRRVERYLERLYRVVKSEDRDGLVTYVNYPSTEYLQLSFLDFVCFNVYLETQDRLSAYLARLQNIAGDRPLVMSELGLDSLRHGEEAQARVLDWQVRTTFAQGCAGALIFSWTDEWFRGGADVDDWAFGVTRRDRSPKPALNSICEAFAEVPFSKNHRWPRISVVVCSYNGARTIQDCLQGLRELEYPDFEVIIVNDGSTDETGPIARESGFKVITTENRGLSSARNTGLWAATGEIVAYIDDDAYPDRHWLTYLAAKFLSSDHIGVGGPNLPPPGDGVIADGVASAPGGPVHVLLTDELAEHIPGCNMAFQRDALLAIGGFDPQFRTAGDDVDVCWRLQAAGGTLGFSPAAMVWHHRRNSVRAYWRQQRGYGRAEAMLERKWPEKYNGLGHLTWVGRVYADGLAALGWWRGRIYQGVWGSAPFQSLYQPAPSTLASLVEMPEWYLLVLALAAITVLGTLWAPLLWAAPLLGIAVVAPVLRAAVVALRISLPHRRYRSRQRAALRALIAFLHLMQPLARLRGRTANGLSPVRWRVRARLAMPRRRVVSFWCPQWQEPLERLAAVERALRARGVPVRRGGDYDAWDLEISGGMLGAARMLMAVEDHGAGTQFVRVRTWPRWSARGLVLAVLVALLATGAAVHGAAGAAFLLAAAAAVLVARAVLECAMTTSLVAEAAPHAGLGGDQ